MMETLLTNAYTCLDQKSKPFQTNSKASAIKELLQRKIYTKKHHFCTKWQKFMIRVNGGYEMIWKLNSLN